MDQSFSLDLNGVRSADVTDEMEVDWSVIGKLFICSLWIMLATASVALWVEDHLGLPYFVIWRLLMGRLGGSVG